MNSSAVQRSHGRPVKAEEQAISVCPSKTGCQVSREATEHAGSWTIASASTALNGPAFDPEAMLMRIQTQLRDAGVDRAQTGIAVSQTRAEQQKIVREIALQKAEETGGFLGISGVLGDVLKAVVVVATTAAAAVCTGGVGAGLAIAGAALILCAKPITNAAVELGVVSKEDASKFQLGVELVGAALTLGSGLAGGGAAAGSSAASAAAGAANTSAQTAQTIKVVTDVVENVAIVLQAINRGGAAVLDNIRTNHVLDGEVADSEIEHAHQLTEGQLETFKETLAQSARSHEQLENIREQRAQALLAGLRDW